MSNQPPTSTSAPVVSPIIPKSHTLSYSPSISSPAFPDALKKTPLLRDQASDDQHSQTFLVRVECDLNPLYRECGFLPGIDSAPLQSPNDPANPSPSHPSIKPPTITTKPPTSTVTLRSYQTHAKSLQTFSYDKIRNLCFPHIRSLSDDNVQFFSTGSLSPVPSFSTRLNATQIRYQQLTLNTLLPQLFELCLPSPSSTKTSWNQIYNSAWYEFYPPNQDIVQTTTTGQYSPQSPTVPQQPLQQAIQPHLVPIYGGTLPYPFTVGANKPSAKPVSSFTTHAFDNVEPSYEPYEPGCFFSAVFSPNASTYATYNSKSSPDNSNTGSNMSSVSAQQQDPVALEPLSDRYFVPLSRFSSWQQHTLTTLINSATVNSLDEHTFGSQSSNLGDILASMKTSQQFNTTSPSNLLSFFIKSEHLVDSLLSTTIPQAPQSTPTSHSQLLSTPTQLGNQLQAQSSQFTSTSLNASHFYTSLFFHDKRITFSNSNNHHLSKLPHYPPSSKDSTITTSGERQQQRQQGTESNFLTKITSLATIPQITHHNVEQYFTQLPLDEQNGVRVQIDTEVADLLSKQEKYLKYSLSTKKLHSIASIVDNPDGNTAGLLADNAFSMNGLNVPIGENREFASLIAEFASDRQFLAQNIMLEYIQSQINAVVPGFSDKVIDRPQIVVTETGKPYPSTSSLTQSVPQHFAQVGSHAIGATEFNSLADEIQTIPLEIGVEMSKEQLFFYQVLNYANTLAQKHVIGMNGDQLKLYSDQLDQFSNLFEALLTYFITHSTYLHPHSINLIITTIFVWFESCPTIPEIYTISPLFLTFSSLLPNHQSSHTKYSLFNPQTSPLQNTRASTPNSFNSALNPILSPYIARWISKLFQTILNSSNFQTFFNIPLLSHQPPPPATPTVHNSIVDMITAQQRGIQQTVARPMRSSLFSSNTLSARTPIDYPQNTPIATPNYTALGQFGQFSSSHGSDIHKMNSIFTPHQSPQQPPRFQSRQPQSQQTTPFSTPPQLESIPNLTNLQSPRSQPSLLRRGQTLQHVDFQAISNASMLTSLTSPFVSQPFSHTTLHDPIDLFYDAHILPHLSPHDTSARTASPTQPIATVENSQESFLKSILINIAQQQSVPIQPVGPSTTVRGSKIPPYLNSPLFTLLAYHFLYLSSSPPATTSQPSQSSLSSFNSLHQIQPNYSQEQPNSAISGKKVSKSLHHLNSALIALKSQPEQDEFLHRLATNPTVLMSCLNFDLLSTLQTYPYTSSTFSPLATLSSQFFATSHRALQQYQINNAFQYSKLRHAQFYRHVKTANNLVNILLYLPKYLTKHINIDLGSNLFFSGQAGQFQLNRLLSHLNQLTSELHLDPTLNAMTSTSTSHNSSNNLNIPGPPQQSLTNQQKHHINLLHQLKLLSKQQTESAKILTSLLSRQSQPLALLWSQQCYQQNISLTSVDFYSLLFPAKLSTNPQQVLQGLSKEQAFKQHLEKITPNSTNYVPMLFLLLMKPFYHLLISQLIAIPTMTAPSTADIFKAKNNNQIIECLDAQLLNWWAVIQPWFGYRKNPKQYQTVISPTGERSEANPFQYASYIVSLMPLYTQVPLLMTTQVVTSLKHSTSIDHTFFILSLLQNNFTSTFNTGLNLNLESNQTHTPNSSTKARFAVESLNIIKKHASSLEQSLDPLIYTYLSYIRSFLAMINKEIDLRVILRHWERRFALSNPLDAPTPLSQSLSNSLNAPPQMNQSSGVYSMLQQSTAHKNLLQTLLTDMYAYSILATDEETNLHSPPTHHDHDDVDDCIQREKLDESVLIYSIDNTPVKHQHCTFGYFCIGSPATNCEFIEASYDDIDKTTNKPYLNISYGCNNGFNWSYCAHCLFFDDCELLEKYPQTVSQNQADTNTTHLSITRSNASQSALNSLTPSHRSHASHIPILLNHSNVSLSGARMIDTTLITNPHLSILPSTLDPQLMYRDRSMNHHSNRYDMYTNNNKDLTNLNICTWVKDNTTISRHYDGQLIVSPRYNLDQLTSASNALQTGQSKPSVNPTTKFGEHRTRSQFDQHICGMYNNVLQILEKSKKTPRSHAATGQKRKTSLSRTTSPTDQSGTLFSRQPLLHEPTHEKHTKLKFKVTPFNNPRAMHAKLLANARTNNGTDDQTSTIDHLDIIDGHSNFTMLNRLGSESGAFPALNKKNDFDNALSIPEPNHIKQAEQLFIQNHLFQFCTNNANGVSSAESTLIPSADSVKKSYIPFFNPLPITYKQYQFWKAFYTVDKPNIVMVQFLDEMFASTNLMLELRKYLVILFCYTFTLNKYQQYIYELAATVEKGSSDSITNTTFVAPFNLYLGAFDQSTTHNTAESNEQTYKSAPQKFNATFPSDVSDSLSSLLSRLNALFTSGSPSDGLLSALGLFSDNKINGIAANQSELCKQLLKNRFTLVQISKLLAEVESIYSLPPLVINDILVEYVLQHKHSVTNFDAFFTTFVGEDETLPEVYHPEVNSESQPVFTGVNLDQLGGLSEEATTNTSNLITNSGTTVQLTTNNEVPPPKSAFHFSTPMKGSAVTHNSAQHHFTPASSRFLPSTPFQQPSAILTPSTNTKPNALFQLGSPGASSAAFFSAIKKRPVYRSNYLQPNTANSQNRMQYQTAIQSLGISGIFSPVRPLHSNQQSLPHTTLTYGGYSQPTPSEPTTTHNTTLNTTSSTPPSQHQLNTTLKSTHQHRGNLHIPSTTPSLVKHRYIQSTIPSPVKALQMTLRQIAPQIIFTILIIFFLYFGLIR